MNTITDGLTMIRLGGLTKRLGISPSTIYNKLNPASPYYDPEFPQQVKLGSGAVAWIEQEVNDWLKIQIKKSRN